MDGGEDLNDPIETLQINVRDGENVETFEITVPNAVGFLLLKTTVGHYREEPKDAYDILLLLPIFRDLRDDAPKVTMYANFASFRHFSKVCR